MPLEINNLVIRNEPKSAASPRDKIVKQTKTSERIEPSPTAQPQKWYQKRSQYLSDMISKENK